MILPILVNPVREPCSLTVCAGGGIKPQSALRNDHRLKSVAFSNGVKRGKGRFTTLGAQILLIICLLFVSNLAYSKKIKRQIPQKVRVKTLKDGGYVLYAGSKPVFLKGVIYNPTPVGAGYDYNMFADTNKPWLVDGKLMQEAGINCIRLYSVDNDLEKVKEFIRDMYNKFGIYTIVSDWLGLWDFPRANYADENFREKTKERVLNIVNSLKDEKGLLMWILGNENNYTFSGKIGFWTSPEIEQITDIKERINKRAEIYYTFINDLAKDIKKIDNNHPVALGNGEASFLDIAKNLCPDIDVLAVLMYRGKTFGNFFDNIRQLFNKPVIFSEFGADSYNAYKNMEDEDVQEEFILAQWQELHKNSPFSGNKGGNCLGGALFEWTDEWWKHNEGYQDGWLVHDKEAGWSHGSYFYDIRAKDGLNMNEEWFGIVRISEEKENGINKRLPKKSYHSLQKLFSTFSKRLPK